MSSTFPPKKRDWTPGVLQIGVFMRTKMGATLECVRDKATDGDLVLVTALIHGADSLPAELVEAVRLAHEANLAKARAGKKAAEG